MIDFSAYGELVGVDRLPEDVDPASLAAVCEAVRAYCGWHVAPAAVGDVVRVDQLGHRVIQLPSLRVTEVSAVANADGVPITDFSWSEDGLLRRESGWPSGYGAVSVTFDHGFAAAPATIVAVVADMLRDYANAASGGGIAQVSLDDADVLFANPFAPRGASSDVGVRRDLGQAYGHLLNRFRL